MPGLDPGIRLQLKPRGAGSRFDERMGLYSHQQTTRHIVCRRYERPSATGIGASRRCCRRIYLSLQAASTCPRWTAWRYPWRDPAEKSLKGWSRAWKLDLIEKENPNWEDLFERLLR